MQNSIKGVRTIELQPSWAVDKEFYTEVECSNG